MFLGFSNERTLNVYQQLLRKCLEILSDTILGTNVESEQKSALKLFKSFKVIDMFEKKREGEFVNFAQTLMPLASSYAMKYDFRTSKHEKSIQETIESSERV